MQLLGEGSLATVPGGTIPPGIPPRRGRRLGRGVRSHVFRMRQQSRSFFCVTFCGKQACVVFERCMIKGPLRKNNSLWQPLGGKQPRVRSKNDFRKFDFSQKRHDSRRSSQNSIIIFGRLTHGKCHWHLSQKSGTRSHHAYRRTRHSTFNFQLSTFNFQLSTFNFQLSTFNFQLSTFVAFQKRHDSRRSSQNPIIIFGRITHGKCHWHVSQQSVTLSHHAYRRTRHLVVWGTRPWERRGLQKSTATPHAWVSH